MQELLNKLMAEVGLSSEQAGKALTTVVGHVKGLLPDSFGATIDNMLGAKPEGSADAKGTDEPGLMSKAADMAGDAKEKMEHLADTAKEKLAAFTSEENIDALKDKAEDLKDKAEDMAENAINKLKGLFGGKED